MSRHKKHSTPVLVSASKIKEKACGSEYVQDYVKDIISTIEDDIQNVIESGSKKNNSCTELPTTFDIPGMSNERSQMYIYYHVIRILEKRHYFPRIHIRGRNSHEQRIFLTVEWFSEDDILMERHMNRFIKKHMAEN